MLILQMIKLRHGESDNFLYSNRAKMRSQHHSRVPWAWTSLEAPKLPQDVGGRWGHGDQLAQPSPFIKGETEEKRRDSTISTQWELEPEFPDTHPSAEICSLLPEFPSAAPKVLVRMASFNFPK